MSILLALLATCAALPQSQSAAPHDQSKVPAGVTRSVTFPAGCRLDKDGCPIVPLTFPVLHPVHWSDTWGAPRDGGKRKHVGQDLPAPKMTPLVACFSGTVNVIRSAGVGGHNMLTIEGDDGFAAAYMHINNDTPGTDDGLGTAEYGFPAGLQSGNHVEAGQLVAWVGDSGNAENTIPHCHFELYFGGLVFNAAASLRAARHITEPVANLQSKEIKPAAGEERFDGIVRSVDSAKSVLCIDLISTVHSNGCAVSIRKPEKRWVRLGDCRIVSQDDSGKACGVRDLAAGERIIVLGAPGSRGESTRAKEIVFTPPPEADIELKTWVPKFQWDAADSK